MYPLTRTSRGLTLIEVIISVAVLSILLVVIMPVVQSMTNAMDSGKSTMSANSVNQIILTQLNEELFQSSTFAPSLNQSMITFGGTPVVITDHPVGQDRYGNDVQRDISVYPELYIKLPDPNNPFDCGSGTTNWEMNDIAYVYDPNNQQVVRTNNRTDALSNAPQAMGANIELFGAYRINEPLLGLNFVGVICISKFGSNQAYQPTENIVPGEIRVRPMN